MAAYFNEFRFSDTSYIHTGTFGKSKNYGVSATMRMIDMGKFSTNYGYMGIAFNMMDSKNYDIAYVRFIFDMTDGLRKNLSWTCNRNKYFT